MGVTEATLLQALDLLTIGSLDTLAEPRRSRVAEVRAILQADNTIGIGIAEKLSGRDQAAAGYLALTFYVKNKLGRQDLRAADIVPSLLPPLLADGQAIPTDVVGLGELRMRPIPQAPDPAVRGVTNDPVQPGNSIGLSAATTGTLGAIVRAGEQLLALSNNHVLADLGNPAPSSPLPIFYPGPFDHAVPPIVVGTLRNRVKLIEGGEFVNRADAAVALLSDEALRRLRPPIRDLELLPAGVGEPRRDMSVEKVGRTTGRTAGRILDVNFRFVANGIGLPKFGFVDQVLCTPFTADGDSGSLVLDMKTRNAVGLHFFLTRDNDKNSASVFSPLGPALDAMGVELVTR
jgi:hypothetical protein